MIFDCSSQKKSPQNSLQHQLRLYLITQISQSFRQGARYSVEYPKFKLSLNFPLYKDSTKTKDQSNQIRHNTLLYTYFVCLLVYQASTTFMGNESVKKKKVSLFHSGYESEHSLYAKIKYIFLIGDLLVKQVHLKEIHLRASSRQSGSSKDSSKVVSLQFFKSEYHTPSNVFIMCSHVHCSNRQDPLSESSKVNKRNRLLQNASNYILWAKNTSF